VATKAFGRVVKRSGVLDRGGYLDRFIIRDGAQRLA
jgi:hypothetical protein